MVMPETHPGVSVDPSPGPQLKNGLPFLHLNGVFLPETWFFLSGALRRKSLLHKQPFLKCLLRAHQACTFDRFLSSNARVNPTDFT